MMFQPGCMGVITIALCAGDVLNLPAYRTIAWRCAHTEARVRVYLRRFNDTSMLTKNGGVAEGATPLVRANVRLLPCVSADCVPCLLQPAVEEDALALHTRADIVSQHFIGMRLPMQRCAALISVSNACVVTCLQHACVP